MLVEDFPGFFELRKPPPAKGQRVNVSGFVGHMQSLSQPHNSVVSVTT